MDTSSDAAVGLSTSSVCHSPPFWVISDTRSGVREGCRDVAITVWPFDWTARASERPRPEEHPVISQLKGRLGLVKVGVCVVMAGACVDMVVCGLWWSLDVG